jgi:hypothetical protein
MAKPKAVGVAVGLLLIVMLCPAPAAMGQAGSKIQAWSSDIHDSDLGAPGGGAAAIAIVGARNGAFSGKVMVGSDTAIGGLKATVGDLKGAGTIPAGNCTVRYGAAWDGGLIGSIAGADILLETPLPEFPVNGKRCAVPVWVTVQVPKDAKAGAYSGELKIEAKGGAFTVPLKLDVQDWTLPDPQNYRVWTEIVEQPDTLAAEFKVPLWSDQHWEMIAKSLRLISPTGSRVVQVPLICRTNYGNDETMVRWVKRPDGKYDYDYSLMEKYLDTVAKNLGTPKIVIFNIWDTYLVLGKEATAAPVEVKGAEGSFEYQHSALAKALQERAGKGPVVTVVDPATKKAEQFALPRYEDANVKELWRPLWEGVRTRMKARGLEAAMLLGQSSDRRPSKDEVAFWNEMTGGLAWMSCTHTPIWPAGTQASKNNLQGIATITYADAALEHFFNLNPAKGRYYGWQEPLLRTQYWRFGTFNANTLSTIRSEGEVNITGRQRGLGHIGGDFWPCFKSKSGKRTGSVTDRYPESFWHSLNILSWLLAPGQAGPVGTARLEVFREGLQECEARIAIESALTDEAKKAKLGDELAKRAQDTLDERLTCIWKGHGATDADFQKYGLVNYKIYGYDLADEWKTTRIPGHKWFLTSGWAQRESKLFALAGEVAAKLAK